MAEWQAGGGVLLTTIRSFKGLEADALVMIDLPKPDSKRVFSMADFYVGCSGAKSVLHLVASEPLGRDYSKAAYAAQASIAHEQLIRNQRCQPPINPETIFTFFSCARF